VAETNTRSARAQEFRLQPRYEPVGRIFCPPLTPQGNRVKEESSSFLKKRRRPPCGNQKTFAYWARACGQSQGMKVFCFFFSKKKTFLWLACLHPIALLTPTPAKTIRAHSWYSPPMSQALRTTTMSREAFLDWAEAQNERYEFDGVQPVGMVGGTRNHSQICQNLYFALRTRLRGTGCTPLGPDAGIATLGRVVRFPDALVTCTKSPGTDRLIPGAVVVFEVVSPGSDRIDRIEKPIEYRAVETIRRYIIVESRSPGVTVLHRATGTADWTETPFGADATLHLPEIGIAVPVAEFYSDTDLL
jgi:Uma2 family endonuclease